MKVMVGRNEFVNIVRRTVKGTTAATVDLDAPQDKVMRKTGNPFVGLGIVKRETLNGIIGYIYANSVNRIADKEGKEERQAKPHPWGDMDEKHLFRINRKSGKPYLSMKVQAVTVHGFFMPDGTEVNADEIRSFIPEKVKSSTQSDLDGEVIARDYDLENIKEVRFAGGEYMLTADEVKPVTVPVEAEADTVTA